MRDATCSDLVARPIEGLLSFTNAEHRRSRRFVYSLTPHPLKQSARMRN